MAENKQEFQGYEFPDEVEIKGKPLEKEINAEAASSEIEIEDDTPPQDRGRKAGDPPEEVTDDELSQYDKKVQNRLKKFTKGYHDERRAKEEALRLQDEAINAAKALVEENKRLQQQLEEGSKIYIEQGKSSAQLELDAAKRAFKEAYEAGDADLLADAQMRISQATLKIERAGELRPIQAKEVEVNIPQEAQRQPQLDSKTAEWLENNSWYGEDDEMSAAALGLHKKLEKEYGSAYIGSDQYFKRIDDTMRKRFPEYFGSEENEVQPEEETQTRAKPASNVVAPATRSTPPSKIKLTKTQVALAKRLGVPLDLYAKKVAEQMNGGQ
jgi:hypothetical protein